MNLIIDYFNILFGVLVGIILSPIAYKVNKQSESKEAINNFYIELVDIIILLKAMIIDTYSNFISCKNASAGKLINIIRIEQLELLSLDKILSYSLKNLSFDQRKGIRQIKRHITMLNEMFRDSQESYFNSIEFWKMSIRILSRLFFLSNQMSSKKEKYYYNENNVNKTIDDVLQQVILQDKQYINEVSQEINT